MKLAIYDAPWNEYVTRMYFAPLESYARKCGIEVKRIRDPIPETGWTMLCNAGLLTEKIVAHYEACDCKLVAVSCNDSAHLAENISAFFHRIPLLFTVSGVQNVNHGQRAVMTPELRVTTEPVQFLPDEEWQRYAAMDQAGRLLPLPYIPWDRLTPVAPEEKREKILFLGGGHFWRFVAYLHALKKDMAHPLSGFLLRDYFSEGMDPAFRFCQKCRDQWKANARWMPASAANETCECEPKDFSLDWNNRTPRAFLRLAQQFGANMKWAEHALNFERRQETKHLRAIASATHYADCKWEFSIHTAQRFWEAASVDTVNLMPARAADQEYFPKINPGEHYATYANDFSDIGDNMETGNIANNCRGVYEEWIRPTDYVTNTKLLAHILERIAACAS